LMAGLSHLSGVILASSFQEVATSCTAAFAPKEQEAVDFFEDAFVDEVAQSQNLFCEQETASGIWENPSHEEAMFVGSDYTDERLDDLKERLALEDVWAASMSQNTQNIFPSSSTGFEERLFPRATQGEKVPTEPQPAMALNPEKSETLLDPQEGRTNIENLFPFLGGGGDGDIQVPQKFSESPPLVIKPVAHLATEKEGCPPLAIDQKDFSPANSSKMGELLGEGREQFLDPFTSLKPGTMKRGEGAEPLHGVDSDLPFDPELTSDRLLPLGESRHSSLVPVQVGSGIINHLQRHSIGGGSPLPEAKMTFQIELVPAHLGRLEITFAFQEGGLFLNIQGAEEALRLLASEQADLKTMLLEAGFSLDTGGLSFGEKDEGQNPHINTSEEANVSSLKTSPTKFHKKGLFV
jgi:hypothetical protein